MQRERLWRRRTGEHQTTKYKREIDFTQIDIESKHCHVVEWVKRNRLHFSFGSYNRNMEVIGDAIGYIFK